jgi:hypothetical protein
MRGLAAFASFFAMPARRLGNTANVFLPRTRRASSEALRRALAGFAGEGATREAAACGAVVAADMARSFLISGP